MKKVAVLCLTAAMTMSLLAGCGGTKKNADGETTEVTTEAESTEEEETTTEKATEEETEEPTTEALGVSDGDKVININFDDKDTDGFHTYTNGGNEEMTNEDGELHINIKNTQAVHISFFRMPTHQLHAQTNPQHRLTQFLYQLTHISPIQKIHGRFRFSYSGKDNFIRSTQHSFIRRNLRLNTQAPQGIIHRSDVTCIIFNDCNLHQLLIKYYGLILIRQYLTFNMFLDGT